ncbi:hypothetical protein [Flavobacterium sp.]|uniref:hypothetical protein n=1 Tax=Flavobacterium sp. TaxID=239 RepID=UPI003D152A3C
MEVDYRKYIYWTELASYFKKHDEHLLFAKANKRSAKEAKQFEALKAYDQTFIFAVKAIRRNNTSQKLFFQGYETDKAKIKSLSRKTIYQ